MKNYYFRAWDGERIFIPNIIPNPSTNPDHHGGCLMQFTGLKDKNGKDIYEDDVVKTLNGDWGVIRYESPFFGVTVSSDTVSHYRSDWMEQCEVIGNIHENPELVTR